MGTAFQCLNCSTFQSDDGASVQALVDMMNLYLSMKKANFSYLSNL